MAATRDGYDKIEASQLTSDRPDEETALPATQDGCLALTELHALVGAVAITMNEARHPDVRALFARFPEVGLEIEAPDRH